RRTAGDAHQPAYDAQVFSRIRAPTVACKGLHEAVDSICTKCNHDNPRFSWIHGHGAAPMNGDDLFDPSDGSVDRLRQAGSRRVRVLNGPLRGMTHFVGERLGIGRASSSDIQLVHDGISRQHAQIVTDEHGRHVLVDLDSSNGTFIEGQRIRRHVLAPGTSFKIMRIKLVYEEVVEESVEYDDSGVFAVRRIDRETLRGTIDYAQTDLPQPAAPRPRVAGDTEPGLMAAEPEEDRVVARSSGRRTSSAAAAQARGEERHRVVATRKDGSTYEGSLIDDIVDYRELRNRIQRGDAVGPRERALFDALEIRLRAPEPSDQSPARRDFSRFLCHFPAKLRFVSGDELSAAVLDLGVDGTRLRVYDHQIEHDSIVWLAIHLVTRGRARTVVF